MVEEAGVEPTINGIKDRWHTICLLFIVAREVGFEPTISELTAQHITAMLLPNIYFIWRKTTESNCTELTAISLARNPRSDLDNFPILTVIVSL